MAEYIWREAAIKAVEKADYTAISSDADDCKADYLREIIESVPAADVVPVVRCKDCKYQAERPYVFWLWTKLSQRKFDGTQLRS